MSTIQWYKNVAGMETITLKQDLITVKSSYFKIVSTGKMNNMSKAIRGIVRKEDQTVKIISWRQD